MDVIYFISVLISFVVLICFFVMTSNIGTIKTYLVTRFREKNTALDEYHRLMFWDDQAEAKEKLKEAFWFELKVIQRQFLSKTQKLTQYEELKKRFEKPLSTHNLTAPEWDGEKQH